MRADGFGTGGAATGGTSRPRDVSGPGGQPRPISVSRLNSLIRETLEGSLPALWVAGEVAGWKRYPSGHCYFSLRDAGAQARCVMFRNEAQRLPADPDDGARVRAFGTASLYEKKGEFQFVVYELEARDAGGLWRIAFEKLRGKLEAEGLLAAERKRRLPAFPSTVGVVTSPVGAVLHDILHVLQRRAPWTRVIFCPTRVQGPGAAEELAAAIGRVGRHGLADVLIVGRGGGSVEDLWAFNEEVVARAIAASPIPVISAVGHEVDVTIADLVADSRAATPSAAAELAAPDGVALRRSAAALASRLQNSLRRDVSRRTARVDNLAQRLERGASAAVGARKHELRRLAAQLEALSPLAALARGFAVPQTVEGRILRQVAQFEPGELFRLRVVDGRVLCRVEDRQVDAETEDLA
jgi:exodeoxyribonuclease VII large subunit